MDEDLLFPRYIPRGEEDQIRREITAVAAHHDSRAVFLYGPGGIGKTRLVRELARSGGSDSVVWVQPIDVDDADYWLLSNLERKVAHGLDPGNLYFGPYAEYLSRLPSFTRSHVGHETVLSHLGRIKQIFLQCYRDFVDTTGKTVVITFDTVEAIRGMYLQVTLTQWMKALPSTLFILSGRPPLDAGRVDPLAEELDDPHQRIPVQVVRLGEFSWDHALNYLKESSISVGLDLKPRTGGEGARDTEGEADEKQKLALLTRGHPLWLAFAVSYLKEKGMPDEASGWSVGDIKQEMPYGGDMTASGVNLHEDFKRRLVTPYREADFWHEGIKRLAVIRQSVNEDFWRELMADHPLPPGTTLDETWGQLLERPWIRKRANEKFVTLHDAVAEELAQRIISVHDLDGSWRRELWDRSVTIYDHLTEEPEMALADQLAAVDERLSELGPSLHEPVADPWAAGEQRAFIQHVSELDTEKRELDQLKAARLFYQLLRDPHTGTDQFLELFAAAVRDHDVLFEDLLALEMQRFLPDGAYVYALGDVIGAEIENFRAWLQRHPVQYIDVCLAMAEYFIEERPQEALSLLDHLEHVPAAQAAAEPLRPPAESADHTRRYQMHILRGNACMRIPGQVRNGLHHFQLALAAAAAEAVPADERPKLQAKAYKELGYYYRNEGMWKDADEAYQMARNAILPTMTIESPDDDREEMASIQTNWAYVKGLVGKYREGSNLVESAITIRHRLKKYQEEGNSWSVCGEVYRYERRFQKSWEAFAQAEQIFLELRNWSWLGVVYQEQAICLFQACQEGINLLPGRDPVDQARRLVLRSLDICRDQSVRGYPSALNRAGRIYGDKDFDLGIRYLAEGIEWARRLSDGWFLLANLVEYVEANFRAWSSTQKTAYIDQITARQTEIEEVIGDYAFPDLKGRWKVLQGHLAIRRWTESHDQLELDFALKNYTDGFGLIAQGYVGSSGAAAIPGEFATFARQVEQLPVAVWGQWQEHLRREWSALEDGSTLVLARLEELS